MKVTTAVAIRATNVFLNSNLRRNNPSCVLIIDMNTNCEHATISTNSCSGTPKKLTTGVLKTMIIAQMSKATAR